MRVQQELTYYKNLRDMEQSEADHVQSKLDDGTWGYDMYFLRREHLIGARNAQKKIDAIINGPLGVKKLFRRILRRPEPQV